MNRDAGNESAARRPLSKGRVAAALLAAAAVTAFALEAWTRFRVQRGFEAVATLSIERLPMAALAPGSPLVHRLRPGMRGFMDGPTTNVVPKHFGPVTYTVNEAGFRGRPVTIPKPAETRRVLFLGDSFTFGWGVNDDETFCVRLEALLNDFKAGNDVVWECVNLGASGYNTIQERILFEESVDRFKPDVVALVYYRNDTEPNLDSKSNPTLQYRHARFWLWEEAKIRLNNRLGREAFKVRKLIYTNPLESFRERGLKWRESKEAHAGIARGCRERGIPFLTVIQPAFDINQPFDADFPVSPIHAEVARGCREENARCVDLLDQFEPGDNVRLGLRGDGHTNAAGHREIARILEPVIRELGTHRQSEAPNPPPSL